jgi:hypothetical protein
MKAQLTNAFEDQSVFYIEKIVDDSKGKRKRSPLSFKLHARFSSNFNACLQQGG